MAAATATSAGDLRERVGELAGRFTTAQKAMMGAATAAVVLAMALVARSASSTEMSPLYSNLKATDAAAVTEKLSSQGVQYQLAEGGATIMVPRDKVYDLRLSMAAEGLPESAPDGYALLDRQGITASEFAQQVGYQRAMEGELAKTIGAMDPIAASTVHLAIPKSDVFAADRGKASASVLVRAKPGKTLDPTQVQAIVHLVASSVQDLDPTAVTVADATGQVLAAPGVEGSSATAGDLTTKQRNAYEQARAATIEKLIEPVVGAGKAKVTVSADLDYAQKKATSETYQQPSGDPNVATRLSETAKNETYTGTGGATDTGVLGPDGSPVAGNGGTTDYRAEQSDARNALNRVVEESTSAPGEVQRLSVAVLVDAGATTTDQVNQIQALVSAAAGLSAQRGDTVQVTRMAFGGSEADLAAQQKELDDAKAAEASAATMGMVRQGAVALFLLGLVAYAYRSLRKAAGRRAPGLQAGEVREITPPRAPEPLELDRPPMQLPAELPEPEGPSEEELARDQLTKQVEEMIDQQPAEVANMLRGWMEEGRKGH